MYQSLRQLLYCQSQALSLVTVLPNLQERVLGIVSIEYS